MYIYIANSGIHRGCLKATIWRWHIPYLFFSVMVIFQMAPLVDSVSPSELSKKDGCWNCPAVGGWWCCGTSWCFDVLKNFLKKWRFPKMEYKSPWLWKKWLALKYRNPRKKCGQCSKPQVCRKTECWLVVPLVTIMFCLCFMTHMLHGAGIFTYIWVILFGQMLVNIPHHGAYGSWCSPIFAPSHLDLPKTKR